MSAYEKTMTDILQCPFCGSMPIANNSDETFALMCPNEQCPGRPSTHDFFKADHAIDDWNTRLGCDATTQ